MELLLHTCCAPCSVACIEYLRANGTEPVSFWYNPNIHPVTEYRQRRDCLISYADSIHLQLVVDDSYGLRPFVQAVCDNIDGRCVYCYELRLARTAQYASEHGFDFFTTTLSISPYQDFDLICKTGERLGNQYGVSFLPIDFRPYYREGRKKAHSLGLYMQKYCGCIFSEEERYMKGKISDGKSGTYLSKIE